jgi:hypothetical protein
MGFVLQVVLLALTLLGFMPNLSWASDPTYPAVRFDIPVAVACREISAKSTKAGIKLVEAEIPLSALFGHPQDQVQSIRAELMTFGRLPVIRDFLPNETLIAATDGSIEITESDDGRVSSGAIRLEAGENGFSINGEAKTDGRSSLRAYRLPPPNVVVTTSGTLDRGAGVWFKVERTAQHQLEKQHMIYVIFEVSQAWRCDAVKLAAQATAKDGGVCGERVFCVGLYLKDDEAAEERARNIDLMRKYELVVAGQNKVREIEGYLSYPLLGYGSMAERERIRVRQLQNDFDEELAGLRQFQ